MPKENQHLVEALERYIRSDAPGFALLVEGVWGSGKTHFLRSVTSPFQHDLSKRFARADRQKQDTGSDNRAIYVSVSGCGGPDEFRSRLFRARFPIADKAGFSDIAKQLGKHFAGIDPTIYAVQPGALYIFDDIERSLMPVRQTLGLINDLVEHDGCRAVLLCHPDGFDGEARERWDAESEKLIGPRYGFTAEATLALTTFLKDAPGEERSKALVDSDLQKRFLKVFNAVGEDNLRAMKHALRITLRVLDRTADERFEARTALQDMSLHIFAHALAVRSRRLPRDAIETMRQSGRPYLYTLGNDGPVRAFYGDLEDEQLRSKSYMPTAAFADILLHDHVDAEAINAFLSTHAAFTPPAETPSWQIVWYGTHNEDDAFEAALNDMEQKWSARDYIDLGVILHVAMLRYWCANEDLIEGDEASIAAEIDAYLRDIASDPAFIPEKPREAYMSRELFRSFGLAHTGSTSRILFGHPPPRLYSATQTLVEAAYMSAEDIAKVQWADDLLETLLSDPEEFREAAAFNARGAGGVYCSYPLFRAEQAETFVDLFATKPVKQRLEIIDALANRYSNNFLKQDENWEGERLFLEGVCARFDDQATRCDGIAALRWSKFRQRLDAHSAILENDG